ncbi:luciferase domain-containing protein [Bacillus sp. GB_SG_008]|uniref:luciferase domain-containing protein n=1 Tax=Bacillus sp. GB_SG_008 TaxID=3454627 RepID=UPI003F875B58
MSLSEMIKKELLSWNGVTEKPHRYGGIEFNYKNKELGHIHGDTLADLPFPKSIRDEILKQGLAQPHHILPDSGWVSYYMKSEDDLPLLVHLFRLQYDRIVKKLDNNQM